MSFSYRSCSLDLSGAHNSHIIGSLCQCWCRISGCSSHNFPNHSVTTLPSNAPSITCFRRVSAKIWAKKSHPLTERQFGKATGVAPWKLGVQKGCHQQQIQQFNSDFRQQKIFRPENFGPQQNKKGKDRKGSPYLQASFWGKIAVKLFNCLGGSESWNFASCWSPGEILGTLISSLCWKAGWLFTKSWGFWVFPTLEFTSVH